ncbi:MAG: HAMP domain-containing protein [Nitrospirae bacterium]|nr:HAMP domain-containing protein [Nitrospirota bacterium]
MKWTLNRKLILMIVSLSASLILMMTLFGLYSERLLLEKLQKKTTEITEAIHLAIQEISKTEQKDIMGLFNYLKNLRTEGIKEISIIDSETRIQASTNPFKVGETTPEYITELIFKSELGEFVTKEGQLYHIVLPIVIKGEHQGYIHLTISNRDIMAVLKKNMKLRLLVTATIMLIGFIATVWLAKRYTRPIKEIVSAASAISSGDLDVKLKVTENDEIGELKESFNQMTARLAELRRIEQRLREAEHLSTIGELSRSVAHEIRNPLNFISLSIDHLMGQCREETRELLLNIKNEIKRLDSLVESFLQYGKPLRLKPEKTDLITLVEDTLSLIRARAERSGITIKREYPDSPLNAEVDPELLKTCLFNVILNSIQAMPRGGDLTIKLFKHNHSAILEVTDTGEGLDEKQLDHVFEPFFTTKKQGLGLGLAMTKKVIKEHGGRIEFSSQKGMGTKVRFILPVKFQQDNGNNFSGNKL